PLRAANNARRAVARGPADPGADGSPHWSGRVPRGRLLRPAPQPGGAALGAWARRPDPGLRDNTWPMPRPTAGGGNAQAAWRAPPEGLRPQRGGVPALSRGLAHIVSAIADVGRSVGCGCDAFDRSAAVHQPQCREGPGVLR